MKTVASKKKVQDNRTLPSVKQPASDLLGNNLEKAIQDSFLGDEQMSVPLRVNVQRKNVLHKSHLCHELVTQLTLCKLCILVYTLVSDLREESIVSCSLLFFVEFGGFFRLD